MTALVPNQTSAIERLVTARALWTLAPRFCDFRTEPLGRLQPDDLLVRTLYSGISGGTESLVFAGKVPVSEYERMRAPFQVGQFPFPIKYGYAAVGVVEDGPSDWLGARIFALHPHQDRFVIPMRAATRLTDAIPSTRAVLSANLETALNAVWDAGVLPGYRVAIIGAGVLGSLIAAIVGRIAGVELTLYDTDIAREPRASSFGAAFVSVPSSSESKPEGTDFDVVFHTSASNAGLQLALQIAGSDARIVELSWYGTVAVTLSLGHSFHSRRLQLISSQVGGIAPGQRSRFDHARRMAVVQRLLDDARLDALIGPPVDFDMLPAKFGSVLAQRAGLCPLVRYPL